MEGRGGGGATRGAVVASGEKVSRQGQGRHRRRWGEARCPETAGGREGAYARGSRSRLHERRQGEEPGRRRQRRCSWGPAQRPEPARCPPPVAEGKVTPSRTEAPTPRLRAPFPCKQSRAAARGCVFQYAGPPSFFITTSHRLIAAPVGLFAFSRPSLALPRAWSTTTRLMSVSYRTAPSKKSLGIGGMHSRSHPAPDKDICQGETATQDNGDARQPRQEMPSGRGPSGRGAA